MPMTFTKSSWKLKYRLGNWIITLSRSATTTTTITTFVSTGHVKVTKLRVFMLNGLIMFSCGRRILHNIELIIAQNWKVDSHLQYTSNLSEQVDSNNLEY